MRTPRSAPVRNGSKRSSPARRTSSRSSTPTASSGTRARSRPTCSAIRRARATASTSSTSSIPRTGRRSSICSNAARDVRGHVPPVRGAVAARRRLVDVRGDPREQPARRPVGARHRRHGSRHHRTQARRGRAARERTPPPRRRGALPRGRRRPDRARLPLPPGHDADVRQPRRSRSSSDAPPSELLGSRLIDLFAPAEREAELARLDGLRARQRSADPGGLGARAGRIGALVPVDRPRVPRRATARSSSSSRSVATSPSAAGPRCSPATRPRSWSRSRAACRSTRRSRRSRARSRTTSRGSRARSRCSPPTATTLQIGACPSLPSGFWEAIDDLPVGPARALERHRRAPAHRDRGLRHRERPAVGRPPRARACLRPPRRRGRRRSSRATGTRCSARSTCIARVPQSPDAEHEQILSLLAHLASIAIERKAFEERLAHQSMHDPLTGLPNRLLFLDRLEPGDRAVQAHASRGRGAVHRPRPVQERERQRRSRRRRRAARCRSRAGSSRCCGPATRWRASAATSSRSSATTSRPRLRRDRAIEIAERLLETVAEPFVVGGAQTFVSASVGIALGDRRGTPRGAAPRRRRRDVPREGVGSRPRRGVRRDDARPGRRPPHDRERPAPRARARRAAAVLPAGRVARATRAASVRKRSCAGSTPSAG